MKAAPALQARTRGPRPGYGNDLPACRCYEAGCSVEPATAPTFVAQTRSTAEEKRDYPSRHRRGATRSATARAREPRPKSPPAKNLSPLAPKKGHAKTG